MAKANNHNFVPWDTFNISICQKRKRRHYQIADQTIILDMSHVISPMIMQFIFSNEMDDFTKYMQSKCIKWSPCTKGIEVMDESSNDIETIGIQMCNLVCRFLFRYDQKPVVLLEETLDRSCTDEEIRKINTIYNVGIYWKEETNYIWIVGRRANVEQCCLSMFALLEKHGSLMENITVKGLKMFRSEEEEKEEELEEAELSEKLFKERLEEQTPVEPTPQKHEKSAHMETQFTEEPKSLSWAAIAGRKATSTAPPSMASAPPSMASSPSVTYKVPPSQGFSNSSFSTGSPQRLPRQLRGDCFRDRGGFERGEGYGDADSQGGRRGGPMGGGASRHPDSHQLFVGNLPHNITEKEFIDFFTAYGNVVELRVCTRGSYGEFPNFGFVVFDNADPVNHILSNQPIMYNGSHRLNVGEKKARQGDRPNRGRMVGPGRGMRGGMGGR